MLNKQLAILDEVYGQIEWSEDALIRALRVMQLTREDEKIRQMERMVEFRNLVVQECISVAADNGDNVVYLGSYFKVNGFNEHLKFKNE